jgi:hypothetical protein
LLIKRLILGLFGLFRIHEGPMGTLDQYFF